MRRLLIIFIFFNIPLFSNILEISKENLNLENFKISFLHDNNNSLTIKELIKLPFKNIKNKNNFGINKNITWYKIEINNNTNKDKPIYLHNNLAYLSKNIVFFEFSNNKLIKKYKYNLFKNNITNKLVEGTLIYPIILKKNSSKTIYIKNHTLVRQIIDLRIYDKKNNIHALINKNYYSIILLSILFTLALYNMILFFLSTKLEFFYYSLYLFTYSFGFSYMYGIIFHYINICAREVYWINIGTSLVLVFLSLCIKSVFNTKKVNKKINFFLNSIIYFVLINLLIFIFIDMFFAIKLLSFLFIYSFIILLYLSIYFNKQKHPLARIFLLINLTYIFSLGGIINSYEAYFSYSSIILHISATTLVFEALFFSYLFNYRIKLLENKIIKYKDRLLLKNKKEQLGEMIGAITHQLKQPISAISSVSTVLEYKLDNKETISDQYLKIKLLQINQKIEFLIETIYDFKEFFSSSRVNKKSDLSKIIKKAISLLYDEMLLNNIVIETQLDFTKNIILCPNELLHIILNLMQNSKEAFKKIQKESKTIKIIGFHDKNNTIIDIIDNAGGISNDNLYKIFDESYTTKEKEESSGLGLYLCKFILKEHINGSLKVKQIKDGIIFRITLNG